VALGGSVISHVALSLRLWWSPAHKTQPRTDHRDVAGERDTSATVYRPYAARKWEAQVRISGLTQAHTRRSLHTP
jgi:hypothetical protein